MLTWSSGDLADLHAAAERGAGHMAEIDAPEAVADAVGSRLASAPPRTPLPSLRETKRSSLRRPIRSSTVWQLTLGYLLVTSLAFLPFGFERPGTGLERPASYSSAALTDTEVLLSFTIGYASNPGAYGPVISTSREGWGTARLADLEWFDPGFAQREKRSPKHLRPSFSTDMSAFASRNTGARSLPILEFADENSDVPRAGEYDRFIEDAAIHNEICIVRNGPTLRLIRRTGPDGPPPFAFIAAPERPYERWWSTPVYVATFPARSVLFGGYVLLLAIFGT